jgi:hypothetical protein
VAKRGELFDEMWPPIFKQRHIKESVIEPQRLLALWRGEIEDEYAEWTVIGTTAIALKLMEKAESINDAQEQAQEMWLNRYKDR